MPAGEPTDFDEPAAEPCVEVPEEELKVREPGGGGAACDDAAGAAEEAAPELGGVRGAPPAEVPPGMGGADTALAPFLAGAEGGGAAEAAAACSVEAATDEGVAAAGGEGG